MNEMTENNLDKLIEETLERRQLIADLDKLIIADLRRHERRTWIRRWARTVAFSFGIPMILLFFATSTYFFIQQQGASAFTLFILTWPTLALILATHRALKTFSPEDV